MAATALRDEPITRSDAHAVLDARAEDFASLLHQAFRVRQATFGRAVKLCMLQNARSGLCPEDCHYCSQSSVSAATIDRYRLLPETALVDGARRAIGAGARRYCMVTSGRGPSQADIRHLCQASRTIKREFPGLELCVSIGLVEEEQAVLLKESGIGWVNHNLNTSERFHPSICTTHDYADRVRTVRNVKKAGLATCAGGIIGMGENDGDVIDLAFALRDLAVDSLPVNFLHPIDGTPFEGIGFLDPFRALKALCLFRFTNPRADLRAAGGRERNLGEWQSLALYPANSIFVDGYLTTPGQGAHAARQMIEKLGFQVEQAPAEASLAS